jgi:hypothetical protein
MSALSKAVGRFSIRLGVPGIVVGYIVALFAVVAGMVAHPFSNIWLGLLFFLVGAFFVMAVPVIVMAYLFLMVAVYRALMALGRRLIFGAGNHSGLQRTSKPSFLLKNLAPQRINTDLWDRWIDGVW